MEFTFYGGVGEIGGNKFLLEHGDTRVFLDFGKSFSRENEYFDFPLTQPFYIPDLKKIQAILNIRGLYRDSVGEPSVDGVRGISFHASEPGHRARVTCACCVSF
jgi:ribonuclease J